MRTRPTTYYVTDGRYNYFETYFEKEAQKFIEEQTKHDNELRDFYMKKYGRLPEMVDIPDGYHITTNRYD